MSPARRVASLRKLPVLFGALLVFSILLSFQGTQWSTSVMTQLSATPDHSEAGVAPVEQEAALRSTRGTNSTIESPLSKSTKTSQQSIGHKSGSTLSESSGSTSSLLAKPLTASAASTTKKNSTFSACLLIKDDNDILNEWIAYHYHVLNLRNLIVATDPFSETSPSSLLEQWRQPPFNMNIVEWHDKDFMPEYFLQGHYDRVPSFLPAHLQNNPKASIWHKHEMKNPESVRNLTVEEIEADLLQINNHRFRQATFVSRCFRHFWEKQNKWVVHIDTDEYVVINPRLRARPRAVKGVDLPPIPSAGIIVQFLNDMYLQYPKRLLPSCLMMPTILFGATENKNATLLAKVPSGWNRTRFESMRWTYHANLTEIANGLQKAIVDVSTLPDDHPIFVTQLIKSVHQPLDSSYDHWKNGTFNQICRQMTLKPDVDAVRLFPLTTNHYVGSLERYTARQDLRRNLAIYQQKAQVRGGVDDGWIQGWLASFVETHGIEACQRVLGDYYEIGV